MSNILPATYPKQHQYPTPTTRQSTETMVDRAGAIMTITMPVIDGDITIAGGWYYVLQCTIVTTFALFVVDHLLMVAWMGYTKVSRCVCVCIYVRWCVRFVPSVAVPWCVCCSTQAVSLSRVAGVNPVWGSSIRSGAASIRRRRQRNLIAYWSDFLSRNVEMRNHGRATALIP